MDARQDTSSGAPPPRGKVDISSGTASRIGSHGNTLAAEANPPLQTVLSCDPRSALLSEMPSCVHAAAASLPASYCAEWESEPLNKGEAKTHSGLAARLNFFSLDRPDLQFAIKDCSHRLQIRPKVALPTYPRRVHPKVTPPPRPLVYFTPLVSISYC